MTRPVVSEFSRQASQMAASPAFHSEAVLRRIADAVGELPGGAILDLACGPGIVASALAAHCLLLVGVDATPAMLQLAAEKMRKDGRQNACFSVSWVEALPFPAAVFEAAVSRLGLHHFEDVSAVLDEVRRVLRPSARLVIADVVSSEDPEEASLHNALEVLRDPSHVRMLPYTGLRAAVAGAGFQITREETWDQPRAFDEWAAIVADPRRTAPLRDIMRALARAGRRAGIELREEEEDLHFTHRWVLLEARR